jgi:hypothetical protein
MTKKKVYILGGGIGGLTTAHYLNKNMFEIHVIERNSELGGQARSIVREDGRHSEYCWHAVGVGYRHFINLIDEISDDQGDTILSHLKPIQNFIYASNDKTMFEWDTSSFLTDFKLFPRGIYELTGKRYWKDMLKLQWMYTYANGLTDEQMEYFDTILWKDYVSDLSPDIQRWVLDSTSIYLGMDYAKISTHMIFHLMRQNVNNSKLLSDKYSFYSFDQPMNQVWFQPWQRQLEREGVHFHLNCEVIKIRTNESKITSINVRENNWVETVYSDYFVNAMDTKGIADLYTHPNPRDLTFHYLHALTEQVQCQVVFYLDYVIKLNKPTILIFPESEWFLMIRHEGVLWDLKHKDVLSVGIGIWDVDGQMFHKPASHCTRSQIAKECWYQITKAKHTLDLPIEIPDWDIWSSYEYKRGGIETYEPKFSNNANTLQFRPGFNDITYDNLKHATAYVRNQKNLFCMESAVESGLSVAEILNYGSIQTDTRVNRPNRLHRMLRWFNKLFSRFTR